jgi:hypothetical protein
MEEAQFGLLWLQRRALHICWAAVRSAPRSMVEKLERRTNLAEAAVLQVVLYPVQWNGLRERRKAEILTQKRFFKIQFFFRKSSCFLSFNEWFFDHFPLPLQPLHQTPHFLSATVRFHFQLVADLRARS